MSDVAASGGYWIASPAHKIVADPDTITGSIGVIIGKFNVSGLYDLLGISTDYVATSDNATLFSAQQNFTPAQRAYIERSLNETYEDFTKGVAQGPENVRGSRGQNRQRSRVVRRASERTWPGGRARRPRPRHRSRQAALAYSRRANPCTSSASPKRNLSSSNFSSARKTQHERIESLEAMINHILSQMDPIQARMPYELHIR